MMGDIIRRRRTCHDRRLKVAISSVASEGESGASALVEVNWDIIPSKCCAGDLVGISMILFDGKRLVGGAAVPRNGSFMGIRFARVCNGRVGYCIVRVICQVSRFIFVEIVVAGMC